MRVICIYKKSQAGLTIGKIYNAIEDVDIYHIINDYNEYTSSQYPKEWFKTSSEIRNEKIDKLLAE